MQHDATCAITNVQRIPLATNCEHVWWRPHLTAAVNVSEKSTLSEWPLRILCVFYVAHIQHMLCASNTHDESTTQTPKYAKNLLSAVVIAPDANKICKIKHACGTSSILHQKGQSGTNRNHLTARLSRQRAQKQIGKSRKTANIISN